MRVTHIFFDNDGVLVDTEKLYFEACRRGLETLGVELSHELFAEYSLTRGVSCFDIAEERGRMPPGRRASLVAERDEVFAQLIASSECAMPGAVQVVESLARTRTLGVVTSAKRHHFELTHRDGRMSKHFAFDYAREDYVRSKPFADPYLCALQGQGLRPEQCIVVEDSPRGLQAARAAGIECVVIPNPYAPREAFDGAAAVLDSISELPAYLASADDRGS